VEEDVRLIDELRVVELIGEHRGRLSLAGRELWDHMELTIETSQPTDDLIAYGQRLEAVEEKLRRSHDLLREDRSVWAVVFTLFVGLRASEMAEDLWGVETAEKFRAAAGVRAAHRKATYEGRAVAPEAEMIVDEALALLEAPYSSTS
jgi:hypothetical protein